MAALTAAILGLSALGTGLQAYGAHQSAKAAKKAGKVEGELYDKQASDAIARGEEEASVIGAQSRQLTGAQRASLAAQGIDIGSGSAADIQTNDERIAQINEEQTRLNAAREAFGFTQQGRLARMGAASAAAGYTNQMYSTLIGGAADLYASYRAFGLNRVPRASTAGGAASSGAQSTVGGYHAGTAGR